MTETPAPQVVRNYLAALDAELAVVPPPVARDIRAGIAEELEGLDATTAAARIEQFGDPAFIAAEARAQDEPAPAPVAEHANSTWFVVVASILIAFVPIAGWIAGLTMVWMSHVWRTREKVVATVVAPLLAWFIGFALTGRLVAAVGYLLPVVFLMVGSWLLVLGLSRTLGRRGSADRDGGGDVPRPSSSPVDASWYCVLTALLVALVPVVGWIVGLAMMWLSRAWRVWEKVVATVAAPLVTVAAVLMLAGNRVAPGPNPSLLAAYDVTWTAVVLFVIVQFTLGVWLLVCALPRHARDSRRSAL
jgi:hypothetical protein